LVPNIIENKKTRAFAIIAAVRAEARVNNYLTDLATGAKTDVDLRGELNKALGGGGGLGLNIGGGGLNPVD